MRTLNLKAGYERDESLRGYIVKTKIEKELYGWTHPNTLFIKDKDLRLFLIEMHQVECCG